MYLVVEGEVQKIRRQKPQLAKRSTRFNVTSFNFGSPSMMLLNSINTRNSHQPANNEQLREFEKSFIMNRTSRMSLLSGNLFNELVNSPKRRNKT
jgi:hypothetical protein